MLARNEGREIFSHRDLSSRADEMSRLACAEWEVLLLPVTEAVLVGGPGRPCYGEVLRCYKISRDYSWAARANLPYARPCQREGFARLRSFTRPLLSWSSGLLLIHLFRCNLFKYNMYIFHSYFKIIIHKFLDRYDKMRTSIHNSIYEDGRHISIDSNTFTCISAKMSVLLLLQW